MGTGAHYTQLQLPSISFAPKHSTGVKGVINDARHYETTRRNAWTNVIRNGILGLNGCTSLRDLHENLTVKSASNSSSTIADSSFLAWCDSRRRSLESKGNSAICTKRNRPSARFYGHLDEVDAIGYLDSIEKVSQETTVIVLVYDHTCSTSAIIESALLPIVKKSTETRFIKIHYETMEFDKAAVPTILAYKNQGNLFAKLTGFAERISDKRFSSGVLEQLLKGPGMIR